VNFAFRSRLGSKNLEERFFPFFPCKPLKSHKTAKGILGKIWRIQAILWKYLANPCAPLAGREGATLLESLVASAALAKANAKIPQASHR
jgi:hypothetical protein